MGQWSCPSAQVHLCCNNHATRNTAPILSIQSLKYYYFLESLTYRWMIDSEGRASVLSTCTNYPPKILSEKSNEITKGTSDTVTYKFLRNGYWEQCYIHHVAWNFMATKQKNSNLISKVKKIQQTASCLNWKIRRQTSRRMPLYIRTRAQTDAQVENIMPSAAHRKAVEG